MSRPLRAMALALCAALLLSTPVTANGRADQRGDCSGGPGRWRLVVQREGPRTLRVRYELQDLVSGQTWQLFLSDDGIGIFSATMAADDEQLRVRLVTRDRPGHDRIAATPVNVDSGATCGGSLQF